MLTFKKMTLKPLLESADGVHLTVYLVNRSDFTDLKAQLQETIIQSYEWLNPIMTAEERSKFLEPLDSLLLDARIFKQMKGNIGIFRNEDSFRVLNVPVELEQTCQVATSFHVKPLLKWLQTDREFLLLGLEKESAHLYLGSQDSFKLIDSLRFPKARQMKVIKEETFSWLNEWLSQNTKSTKPKLFVAGENSLVENISRNLKYKNAVKTAVAPTFGKQNVTEICLLIRTILKADSKDAIEKSLNEFRFAEAGNRVRKNIFQISKAVVQGRVRKLIVTDEINIFGKIDKKTGGISIHPFDLDHEDDDILDDLAQMVLSQGGEVIVASRDEIPKGRPILAILDDDDIEIEKTKNLPPNEIVQARFV